MQYVKLTPRVIRSLTLPAGVKDGKTFFEWPGFGVRLRTSGSRIPIIQYDVSGKTKRIPVSPPLNLAGTDRELERAMHAARQEARQQQAKVRLGGDPAADKVRARVHAAAQAKDTFGGELLQRYLQQKQKKVRPGSYVGIARHLNINAKPLHRQPVGTITQRDVAKLLTNITERSGPVAANHTRSSIRAYFRWLGGEIDGLNNVAAGTNKAETNGSRDRVLADPELAEIWTAIDQLQGFGPVQFGTIAKLLLLTGLRRLEIGMLKWSEIDFAQKTITLPPTRVKNATAHVVPLSAPVLELLDAQPRRSLADGRPRDLLFGADWGAFGAWADGKEALDRQIAANRKHVGISAAMPHWTLHDFRRTLSTRLNDELNVDPFVVEALLGHYKQGVAGIYNRAEYRDKQRAALERWADHLEGVVHGGGKPAAKVISLPVRK
jgi:integrase